MDYNFVHKLSTDNSIETIQCLKYFANEEKVMLRKTAPICSTTDSLIKTDLDKPYHYGCLWRKIVHINAMVNVIRLIPRCQSCRCQEKKTYHTCKSGANVAIYATHICIKKLWETCWVQTFS